MVGQRGDTFELAVTDARLQLVSPTALLAGGIATASEIAYLVLVSSEGDNDWTRVAAVTVQIGIAAAAAGVAAFLESPAARVALLTLAAAVFLAWTVLGALSIGGLLLAPAAVLAWVEASKAAYLLRPSVASASGVSILVAAFAIVVFQLTVG